MVFQVNIHGVNEVRLSKAPACGAGPLL